MRHGMDVVYSFYVMVEDLQRVTIISKCRLFRWGK